jgi:hypothetical protein
MFQEKKSPEVQRQPQGRGLNPTGERRFARATKWRSSKTTSFRWLRESCTRLRVAVATMSREVPVLESCREQSPLITAEKTVKKYISLD